MILLVFAAITSAYMRPMKWSTLHEAFPITFRAIPFWVMTVFLSFLSGWAFPERYWLWPEALFVGHCSTFVIQMGHIGPIDWNVIVMLLIWLIIICADLINWGAISLPAQLFAAYLGRRIRGKKW